MRKTIYLICLAATALAPVSSCKEETGPDPAVAAKSFVYALHNGNYAQAANMTLMIDSAPKNYKDLIAMRYKEIAADHKAEHGKIIDVACKHTDISDSKNEADVYLTLTYSDKTTANILLQLSKDKEEWKIK